MLSLEKYANGMVLMVIAHGSPGIPADSLAGRPRVDVLGVGISAVDLDGALREVERWIETGERRYVCLTNVHCIVESQRDPELRRIHNESGLTLADGTPLLWAGRYAGARSMGRVRGSDFLLAVSGLASRKRLRCYFYGAGPGTPELVARRLTERFPAMEVVGCHSPPFRPLTKVEDAEIVDVINASRPDVLWVGLSAPKQEQWMAAHLGLVNAPVMAGVGAAFDFHAGLVSEAPRWVQGTGLEWLYRLAREPRRLWRRYLFTIPIFIARILLQRPFLRSPSAV